MQKGYGTEQLAELPPGVEIIDSPDDNNGTQAAIVVEVFGYQRWRWQDGEQRNRWGVSAILSVADINGMDTVGYGAMLHTPIKHTALGVVWRDGNDGSEVGVLLNLNLAQLLQKYNNGDLMSFLKR